MRRVGGSTRLAGLGIFLQGRLPADPFLELELSPVAIIPGLLGMLPGGKICSQTRVTTHVGGGTMAGLGDSTRGAGGGVLKGILELCGAGELGRVGCREVVEGGGGRSKGGLGGSDYGLGVAVGEGLGECLPCEVGKRLKHHLSSGRPLQAEEEVLCIKLGRKNTIARYRDDHTYLCTGVRGQLQVHLTTGGRQ